MGMVVVWLSLWFLSVASEVTLLAYLVPDYSLTNQWKSVCSSGVQKSAVGAAYVSRSAAGYSRQSWLFPREHLKYYIELRL